MYVDVLSQEHQSTVDMFQRRATINAMQSTLFNLQSIGNTKSPARLTAIEEMRNRLAGAKVEHARLTRLGR